MLEIEVHVMNILSNTDLAQPKETIQYFISINKL